MVRAPGQGVQHFNPEEEAMPSKSKKDVLKMTRQEADSIGVELPEAEALLPEDLRELPLDQQVAGQLDEEDVTEALTGEVTPETLEDVDEAVADNQEEAAEQPED
jgi:hypothetical protein